MKPAFRALALLAPLLAAAPVQAAVSLDFGGGSGSPLSITITEPFVYVVTEGRSTGDGGLLFVFEDVGNMGLNAINFTGDISFSVNGGPSYGFFNSSTGYSTPGAVGADDFYLSTLANVALSPGDVVTVTAGTITGDAAYNGTVPWLTDFETFLAVSGSGEQISAAGAVPEPSAAALLGLGCAGLVLRRRRSC